MTPDQQTSFLYGLTCDIRRLEHKFERFISEFFPNKKPLREQITELSIFLGEFQRSQENHAKMLEIYAVKLDELKKAIELQTKVKKPRKKKSEIKILQNIPEDL